MTKFLLVFAAIVLSTNDAIALDCKTFFGTTDLQRACFRLGTLTGESRAGVETTCRLLKTAMELIPAAATLGYKKDLETCLREFPYPPAPTAATPSTYTKGLAALNEGNFDAAITEFTAAIANDPKDPFAYISRAEAYEGKGDAASAISDYRKVLTLIDAETGARYAARIRKLQRSNR